MLAQIKADIEALAQRGGSKETLTFVVHHPLHRQMIHEWCEGLGNLTHKSITDERVPMHDDSTLLKHFRCGKCTPLRELEWINDGPSQYARCLHHPCKQDNARDGGGIFHSEYENDKDWGDDDLGFKRVRGHNTVVIKKAWWAETSPLQPQ